MTKRIVEPAGKRPTKSARLVALTEADIERIIGLERKSFIPSLQVDVETLRQRFALGHQMIGLEQGPDLVGMISFSYRYFDPHDRDTFPYAEREFGLLPVPTDYNALFMYNFEVAPGSRGRAFPKLLFLAALERASRDGCKFAVACPRIPSYAGSHEYPQESVEQRPEVKAAIDRQVRGERYPALDELLKDPLLALYYRLGQVVRCRFHWVIPQFAPYDHASGGIRILLYGEIPDPNPAVSRPGLPK
jgi:GNAT superfamily N-acetyltransferase